MDDRTQYHSLSNPELHELYHAAGFGGRVGWGSRPAILVIDMAGAWADPGERLGSDLAVVARSIKGLLDVARQRGDIPVYFTTMAYDPSLRDVGKVVRLKTPHSALMIRGSDRVRLIPELERRADEVLIEKPRASAFFGTNLLSMLISDGVDTLIVVGCSTSGCIRATAEDGFNRNFHVIVPAEAVGDRSWSAHEGSLFDIDARLGDVMALDDVISHITAMPPRPRPDTP